MSFVSAELFNFILTVPGLWFPTWRFLHICVPVIAEHNSDIMESAGVMAKDAPVETRAPKPASYEEDGEEYHDSLRGYTRDDRINMARMGKVQELRRNYRPLSALAFTVILQGTWEVLMT